MQNWQLTTFFVPTADLASEAVVDLPEDWEPFAATQVGQNVAVVLRRQVPPGS